MTIVETCRQRSHHVFAFVTAASEARFAHQTPPLLLGP